MMERLTEHCGDLVQIKKSCNLYDGSIVQRLAEYEDTGFSPADFDKLCREMSEIRMNCGIKTYAHLRDLVKADREGRLLVLPCNDNAELMRDGETYKADHWNHTLTAFRDDPTTRSGKRVALFSIKEAEAALKGEG